MKLSERIHRIPNAILVIVVFVVVGSYTYGLTRTSEAFISKADPYYHIAFAEALHEGSELPMPVHSTIGSAKGELYMVYHRLFALFINQFDTSDTQGLVNASKAYHAFLGGVFAVLFYLMLLGVLRYHVTSIPDSTKKAAALFGVLLLYSVSILFVFRLFLPRPHLLAILLFLGGTYSIVRRKWLGLFAASLVFPFFYSTSFLMLIPAGIYACARFIYDKFRISKDIWYPLGIVVLGLGLGILVHPYSSAYFYNAYVVHILSLGARFVKTIPGPAEFGSVALALRDWLWFVPFISVATVTTIVTIDKRDIAKKLSFPMFFLFVLATVLFILFVFFQRATEYFVPVLVMFMVAFTLQYIVPKIRQIVREPERNDQYHPVIYFVYDIIAIMAKGRQKKLIVGTLSIIVVMYLVANSVFVVSTHVKQESPELFRGAAEYMRDNSLEGDIVFYPLWSTYPRLVFFNQVNHYTMGMDPMFTYMYDREIYWLYYNLVHGDYICGSKECSAETNQDPYDVLKNDFGAKYVFMDKRELTERKWTEFIDRIEGDDRFTLVYEDSNQPEIVVFEL